MEATNNPRPIRFVHIDQVRIAEATEGLTVHDDRTFTVDDLPAAFRSLRDQADARVAAAKAAGKSPSMASLAGSGCGQVRRFVERQARAQGIY